MHPTQIRRIQGQHQGIAVSALQPCREHAVKRSVPAQLNPCGIAKRASHSLTIEIHPDAVRIARNKHTQIAAIEQCIVKTQSVPMPGCIKSVRTVAQITPFVTQHRVRIRQIHALPFAGSGAAGAGVSSKPKCGIAGACGTSIGAPA